MDNFYARSVFFVKDAEAALVHYTQTLGFALDWNYQYEGRAWVFEVSLSDSRSSSIKSLATPRTDPAMADCS